MQIVKMGSTFLFFFTIS